MLTKYHHSQAQLTKLKNQIRVELNQIRAHPQPKSIYLRQRSSKRLFNQKHLQTSISQLPQQRCIKQSTPNKKYIKKDELIHFNQNKSRQRKHYQHSYTDKVDMSIKILKRKSSFMNIKVNKGQIDEGNYHQTSLYGIGKDDKSVNEKSKQGKRVFASKSTLSKN